VSLKSNLANATFAACAVSLLLSSTLGRLWRPSSRSSKPETLIRLASYDARHQTRGPAHCPCGPRRDACGPLCDLYFSQCAFDSVVMLNTSSRGRVEYQ
jgi:hypothetical protein